MLECRMGAGVPYRFPGQRPEFLHQETISTLGNAEL